VCVEVGLEFAELHVAVANPVVELGRLVLLRAQEVREREALPADVAFQERLQRRNAHAPYAAEGWRKFATQGVFVLDRDNGGHGVTLPKIIEGAHRRAVDVGDEQDDRVDATPLGLLYEADFRTHLEEGVMGMEAEVDHLGEVVVMDQLVHQLHLPERVVDRRGFGDARMKIDQRRFVEVDIVGCDDAAMRDQEFAQHPRHQRLADLGAGRADDVNGRSAQPA